MNGVSDRSSPFVGRRSDLMAHLVGAAVVLAVGAWLVADGARIPAEAAGPSSVTAWRSLTNAPRALGTPAHGAAGDLVAALLREAGLTVEEQRTTVVWQPTPRAFVVANVRNIIGRVRGRDATRPVVVVGHYDSAPSSPGAADNGVAVAAMIAAARRLTAGSLPESDVLFLFSDGEEGGLLGARAFVEKHPQGRAARAILNFDARGSGGPLVMFETGRDSARLVSLLAGSGVRTNSLLDDLYRTALTNDTDFTVFRRAGLPGMNFAFIGGSNRYHTPRDDSSHVEQRLIGAEAALMAGLAARIGETANGASGDHVYFSVGPIVVSYSMLVAWLLTVVVVVACGFRLVAFVRTNPRAWRRLTIGVAVTVATLAAIYLFCDVLLVLMWRIDPAFFDLHAGDSRFAACVLGGLAVVGLSIWTALLAFSRTPAERETVQVALVLVWSMTAVAAMFLRPAASFVVWPALAGIGGSMLAATAQASRAAVTTAAMVLAGAGVVVMAPFVHILFAGLTLSQAPLIVTLSIFQVGLLTPVHPSWTARFRWLPVATAATGAIVIAASAQAWLASPAYPRPSSLFYAADYDEHQAWWASGDSTEDLWKAHFLTKDASRRSFADFFTGSRRQFVTAPAPLPDETSVPFAAVSSGDEDGGRVATVEIASRADRATVTLRGALDSLVVGGMTFENTVQGDQPWTITFLGDAARRSVLRVTRPPGSVIAAQVVALTYQPAPLALRHPRPAELTSVPGLFSDTTIVRRRIPF